MFKSTSTRLVAFGFIVCLASSSTAAPPKSTTNNSGWMQEAKQDYLDALKQKEQRMTATAQRLGKLNQGEFELSKEALKQVQEFGVDKVAPDVLKMAANIAPDFVRTRKRELLMKSGEYAKLVKEKKAPPRYPAEKRKELFDQFNAVISVAKEWSLAAWFDDLSSPEMDAAVAAANVVKKDGFGKLTHEQRLLVLKAGGLEYVGKQLGY
jgi:hypothetical protein